jgi:glucose-1-phosphate adenylyltransferase
MDLCRISPQLNLYNYEWPIRSASLQFPAAKFAFDSDDRRGMAVDSIVADGTIISGAAVRNSIVFNNVFVHSHAVVQYSLLLPGCNVGRGVQLERVICDKDVTIEDGTIIGKDRDADEKRFHVSPSGIVVVAKGSIVPREGAVRQLTVRPPPGTLRPRPHEPGSVLVTDD